MQNKISFVCLIFVCAVAVSPVCKAYSGGDGSSTSPYEIADVNDLLELADTPGDYGACFVLTSDIDLSGQTFTTALIAPDTDSTSYDFEGTAFTGTFDGAGHVIRHLTISAGDINYVGLFGCLGVNGQIINLGVVDCSVDGYDNVGGVAGNNSGLLDSCYVTGTVCGRSAIGGLAGYAENGAAVFCYAAGNVSGSDSVGGLVGYNAFSTITSCYALGSVAGDEWYIGGLAGQNWNGTISRCYAAATVSGVRDDIGGLVGDNIGDEGRVNSCFWDVPQSGQTGSAGGKGLTTEQMKTLAIYRNAGWARHGWVIHDGMDYPRLYRQGTGGTEIPAATIPFSGQGTEAEPFLITTKEDFSMLSWYGGVLDKQIKLTADLNLTEVALYPIGDLGPFTGVFDGSGYTISHAVIDQPENHYVGLFGTIGPGGLIRNLGVEEVSIHGGTYVGGLAGYSDAGTINACHVTGVVNGDRSTGGLIGENYEGTVIGCYASADVNGTASAVGGLAGFSHDGTITSCYSTGNVNVTGIYGYAGGLVGCKNFGTISCCYATGNVSVSGWKVGGLVGYSRYGTISSCYATGMVSVNSHSGGFVGDQEGGLIFSSFWDTQASGINDGVGSLDPDPAGILGRTTEQMKTQSTFADADWDYTETWQMFANDYPRLAWEVRVFVPNVTGLTQPAAQSILLAADLTVGKIRLDYSDTVAAGEIISQIPAAGATAPSGSKVMLSVSLGEAAYGEGDGSAESPYQIRIAPEWRLLMTRPKDWNKHFVLVDDIDLSEETVAPVGNDTTPFTGIFDGNNHTIHNVMIDEPENTHVGLFRHIGPGGQVKSLHLRNLYVRGEEYVGGICGENEGMIRNCSVAGDIKGPDRHWGTVCYGGICGLNSAGGVVNCYSEADVQGDVGVGGVVGWSYYTTIERCWAKGSVSGTSRVGGLVGSNASYLSRCYSESNVSGATETGGLVGWCCNEVRDCFAIGTVHADRNVGGLIGRNGFSTSAGNIVRCYSVCQVNGSENAGGFIGNNYNGTVENCFWDTQVSGQSGGIGLGSEEGVSGVTSAEMQTETTFTSSGWDFEKPVWMICGPNYPRLVWDRPDFHADGRVNLADLAALAEHWQTADCGFCSYLDLTGDRNINLYDLLAFCAHWLEEDHISNHVFEIELGIGYDYEDADDALDDEIDYEFEVATDETVVAVEFTTPAGNTFSIPFGGVFLEEQPDGSIEYGREYDNEDKVYYWFYEHELSNSDSLAAYGDGLYTVTVTYENGLTDQTTFRYGVPGTSNPIPQPTQVPRLIGISDGDAVISPVAFNWEPCTDANAEWIWFEAEGDEYIEIDLAKTATGLEEPLSLAGGEWEICLDFETYYVSENADGITIDIGKYCESDYEITVQ